MTASLRFLCSLFFSTPPATPESYTLSLHDALPICEFAPVVHVERLRVHVGEAAAAAAAQDQAIASGVEGALRREQHHARSEERRVGKEWKSQGAAAQETEKRAMTTRHTSDEAHMSI